MDIELAYQASQAQTNILIYKFLVPQGPIAWPALPDEQAGDLFFTML